MTDEELLELVERSTGHKYESTEKAAHEFLRDMEKGYGLTIVELDQLTQEGNWTVTLAAAPAGLGTATRLYRARDPMLWRACLKAGMRAIHGRVAEEVK